MSSARPTRSGRILRSATFRLALFYAALFVMSAGALFATVYITATAAMQSDMQAVLRSEALQLGEISRSGGAVGRCPPLNPPPHISPPPPPHPPLPRPAA